MRRNPQLARITPRRRVLAVLAAAATAVAATPFVRGDRSQAATTFTVTSISDASDAAPGNGVCDNGIGECTLRAAIEESNALAGADTINFNITGAGPHTIAPSAASLPAIFGDLTIDGSTQPGAVQNSQPVGNNAVQKIVLSGAALGPNATGFEIGGGTVTIRGVVINGFAGVGSTAVRGDTGPTNLTLLGNFIGTSADGTTAVPNFFDPARLIACSPSITQAGPQVSVSP